MKVHLAGDGGRYEEVAREIGVPWVMTSYYYHEDAPTDGSGGKWKLDYRHHEHCRGMMMDSGAFSYISSADKIESGANVDWWDYATQYAEYVRDNNVTRYVELDLDSVMGLEFTRELRDHIEDIVGWDCIPVWHRNRGKRAYKRLANDYDRIAMGGFPWNEIGPSEYHHLPWFINEAHKRNARVHALGFQAGSAGTEILEKYPFDSTDSANWMWQAIYGGAYKFDGTQIRQIDHNKKGGDAFHKHNLSEWSKFARHMDGRNEPELGFEW